MSHDFSGHVFALSLGMGVVLKKFGNRIYPGDVLMMNDPYTGGTHLNDVVFYTPFFADSQLILFIAVRAHWADVGGATPGSFSGQDTEIYQEGVRIRPVKIIERGQRNQALWEVLFANMRIPEEREGDALAMLDTARVAEVRISELCAKYYGTAVLEGCREAILDSAERVVRRRISQLPPGEYYYEQYMDNNGLSPEPLPIKVKLTIREDTLTFDFNGSSPQVGGPMNVGPPITQGGTFVIVKALLDPKTPVNGGTFRPIQFVIPEGTILNAKPPAPVGGCWEIFRQIQSATIGLFAQVLPEQALGDTMETVNHVYQAGHDSARGRFYILYEYPQGGTPGPGPRSGEAGPPRMLYNPPNEPGTYTAWW